MKLFQNSCGGQRKLHIIFACEQGPSKSIAVSKTRLRIGVNMALALFVFLFVSSLAGTGYYIKNVESLRQNNGLKKQLQLVQEANYKLEQQVAKLDEEKDKLLSNAIDKLNEKSQLIEAILSTVGVSATVEESRKNTGGPFTQYSGSTSEDLIVRADRYLEKIQTVPLGLPVPGVITSKFGKRNDPINSKSAFHNGVDIRGKRGEEVKATADGVVYQVGRDKGYGRYVILKHDNGYRTMFAHLKKILVKPKTVITRGQKIGLLGNSGRSTGPHVHYEIKYKGKPVNPVKFMRIAKYLSPER